MNFFQRFKYNFCNYAEYEQQLSVLRKSVDDLNKIAEEKGILVNKQIDLIGKKDELISIKEEIVKTYEQQLKQANLTPVDVYCRNKNYKINNVVYKDKVIINGIKIACNMREMIQPNSYVIDSVRKSINKPSTSMLWYQKIMNKVHEMVEWTTDGRDDNYYYPNYTLQTGKGDCDDFAFAQCSIEPELGNAFGFWNQGNGSVGHSFAVGIVDGELYIFDAVPNKIVKAEGNPFYSIYYIITKNSIYVVDDSTVFGEILWGA